MTKGIDWESRIGRRLKLRDLHVLFAVVQSGSMGKAAAHLGVSQPSVSEAIADLEATIGVRMLDRSPQGVEPAATQRYVRFKG
jgi:DNA-binding transcriptional LysR family regulator